MAGTTAPERTGRHQGRDSRGIGHGTWAGPRLRVENLGIAFATESAGRPPLRDVSFDVKHRQCVGLIGEAGAGKTLTARALRPHLLPADARLDGRVLLDGNDIAMQPPAPADIHVLTRNPMDALNPVRTVGQQLTDAVRRRHDTSDRLARQLAVEAMEQVGIPKPRSSLHQYPHHFRAAMRHRLMAAAAVIDAPRVLVMDQPAGVDDATQMTLTDLVCRIAEQAGSAVLLLSRNPALIAGHCHHLVSLHAGEVVESARTDDLLQRPAHPYTAALFGGQEDVGADGPAPAPAEGCLFRGRCAHAMAGCERTQPMVVDQRGRRARCWRHGELNLRAVGW
ncbi:oligopeptide/dipeptide ABC transporter ATP-binding protein [Aquisalimonas asiatica]|uniref:Peptide/nickel transport system ATP-binding protein n=1 Tax=Aquisalimonas asiatica TaxID=406100 RepID=A0A1H8VKW6_9GAMM|nr:oligopeptide/dipeptide ABC transporter ATP-binding protein [Aquisalimonas asiatica]SEP16065.1 peptide/nickel transport system ATP-binding protein [Aquisalimonas asiatica]